MNKPTDHEQRKQIASADYLAAKADEIAERQNAIMDRWQFGNRRPKSTYSVTLLCRVPVNLTERVY